MVLLAGPAAMTMCPERLAPERPNHSQISLPSRRSVRQGYRKRPPVLLEVAPADPVSIEGVSISRAWKTFDAAAAVMVCPRVDRSHAQQERRIIMIGAAWAYRRADWIAGAVEDRSAVAITFLTPFDVAGRGARGN